MKNQKWVQEFIDFTLRKGRLTVAEAAAISGLTEKTAGRYLRKAEQLTSLYRSSKCGLFRNEATYRRWQAARKAVREEMEEVETIMTPYDRMLNVICVECRKSDTMRRIHAFYGRAMA